MSYAILKTASGWIGVTGSSGGLRRVILPLKTKNELEKIIGHHADVYDDSLSDVLYRLGLYFEGKSVEFNDRLDLSGASPFQRRVWEEARNVTYGTTASYGQLAKRLNCKSSRAVGQALGKNPLPVIVPCHRIIGSNGDLTGFAGGLKLKKYLLQLEHAL